MTLFTFSTKEHTTEYSRMAAAVLAVLGYDGINGCYYFTYAGMFHGVEPDGYIHT